jgi:hypothetical protein
MTTAPYIPTEAECGASWRGDLGLTSVEHARAVNHPFRGSHIRGWCFMCEQTQPTDVHGTIHLVNDGDFACDPDRKLDLQVPMPQRTRQREFASCSGCLGATR